MENFNEYTSNELLARVEYNPMYIPLSQVGTVMRKFLFGADFLNDVVIEIFVFTGLSSIQMYDGPGKLSPLMPEAPQYSNITSLVQFYLYIEVTELSYDEDGYITYKNVLDDFYVKRDERSHAHYEWHFADLTSKKLTFDVSIESKRYTNTWYKAHILGDALTLWLNHFSFNGPFVQFLQSNFYMCQFGGLFLRLGTISEDGHTITDLKFYHISICNDDILPDTVLLFGAVNIYVYVLYLVGYSEGSVALNIKNEKHVRAYILQDCSKTKDPCTLHHYIWYEMGTLYNDDDSISDDRYVSSINMEKFSFFLINPPIGSHLNENSISHTSKALHVTAGSRINPITLGVVHILIAITNTKSLTNCINRITIHAVNNFNSSNNDYISVSQASPSNKTYVVPSASYISVKIHTCPSVQNGRT